MGLLVAFPKKQVWLLLLKYFDTLFLFGVMFVVLRDESSRLRSELNDQHSKENRAALEELTRIKEMEKEDMRKDLENKMGILRKTVSSNLMWIVHTVPSFSLPACRFKPVPTPGV